MAIIPRRVREADARIPTTELEFSEYLADQWWRITSGCLYKISNKEGQLVPFHPNKAQLDLLANMHTRNIILKPRQVGFSTLIQILFLDNTIFNENYRSAVITNSQAASKSLFRDKVMLAYNQLPDGLKDCLPLKRESADEVVFQHNGSSMKVSTSTRGGTLQNLHISEMASICKHDLGKAQEIVTGSMPSVSSNGYIFVESTAEGNSGWFADSCKKAEQLMLAGKELNNKEYKLHFYPWYIEPTYTLNDSSCVITDAEHLAFDAIEAKQNVTISLGQRTWYISTRDNDFNGEPSAMWNEYPSDIDEAFKVNKDGSYFNTQLNQCYKDGRMANVPYRAGIPVDTYWDIGNSDGTGIWLIQRVGQAYNVIRYIEGYNEPYEYYTKQLHDLGYAYGTHYLPHDAGHTRQGESANVTPKGMLENLGLSNCSIVPRISHIHKGITATRSAFSLCYFDETNCKAGIEHLGLYSKKWNASMGQYSDTPNHDHSEAADSFRQFAQTLAAGKLDKKTYKPINFDTAW